MTRVYPRGCGGTSKSHVALPWFGGLSPRVRGNLQKTGLLTVEQWSIPAGAGEPWTLRGRIAGSGVYPRGCGGTVERINEVTGGSGLSPRVRGNRSPRARPTFPRGSIPAGAGEMCGGTTHLTLPARVGGSIPAGAGEPDRVGIDRTLGVYPRGCGGTCRFCRARSCGGTGCADWRGLGLSPRVRGNLDRHPRGSEPARFGRNMTALRGSIPAGSCRHSSRSPDEVAGGSIPAGAGEPASLVCCIVYPRGCGGTDVDADRSRGLSPRVRGNPSPRRGRRCHPNRRTVRPEGSIPAGAGEPLAILADSPALSAFGRPTWTPSPL